MENHFKAPVTLVLLAICVESASATAPAAGVGPAVPAGSIAQMVLGLALVLALVGALAWLLKRYSGVRGTGSGLIRVIGGAAVGQRERIVLVELGGTWLLVGVAPGQVRTLHTMPKMESAADDTSGAAAMASPAHAGFSTWLRRISENKDHE